MISRFSPLLVEVATVMASVMWWRLSVDLDWPRSAYWLGLAVLLYLGVVGKAVVSWCWLWEQNRRGVLE